MKRKDDDGRAAQKRKRQMEVDSRRRNQNSTHSSNDMNESRISNHDNQPMSSGVNEGEMVKAITHCIMENASKRGFVRDTDIAELFTNKQEREMREGVLKKAEKLLKDVFAYRLDRDEESKRYYLSTCLRKGVEIAQGIIDASKQDQNQEDDEVMEPMETENDRFKDFLLQVTIMFIFMSKRQSGTNSEMERGLDQILLKSFLEEVTTSFGATPLSNKQFGEWIGPAKSAEFISEGWLRSEILKDQSTGNEEVFYHWGARAETVISKKMLLESFCEIYGATPNNWPNHARIAGLRGTALM